MREGPSDLLGRQRNTDDKRERKLVISASYMNKEPINQILTMEVIRQGYVAVYCSLIPIQPNSFEGALE